MANKNSLPNRLKFRCGSAPTRVRVFQPRWKSRDNLENKRTANGSKTASEPQGSDENLREGLAFFTASVCRLFKAPFRNIRGTVRPNLRRNGRPTARRNSAR